MRGAARDWASEAALVHSVPMVCLPIGRDQPDNAAGVVYRGIGVRLSPTSSTTAIAAAIDSVVHDDALAASARRLAQAIRAGHPQKAGLIALERIGCENLGHAAKTYS